MDYLEINVSNATLPASESFKQFYEVMAEITGIYLFPFISVFGIIGNIFVIVVYAKSKIYSTSLYLIALSLSDILKLLNDLLYFLVMFISKFDSNVGEQIYLFVYSYTHYIFVFTALNTSWLMCLIAFDRYITVVKQRFMDQTKVFISISVILVLSILFAIPAPLFSKTMTVTDPKTNIATRQIVDTALGNSDFKVYYQYINGMLRTVVPVILLIYLNCRILQVVYKNRIKNKSSKNNKSNSRITLMLITIVVVFIICVFPDSIMCMMQLGYASEGYFVRGIREITDVLMALNSASTFLVCVYFSIEFRIKFKQIFMRESTINRTRQQKEINIKKKMQTTKTKNELAENLIKTPQKLNAESSGVSL